MDFASHEMGNYRNVGWAAFANAEAAKDWASVDPVICSFCCRVINAPEQRSFSLQKLYSTRLSLLRPLPAEGGVPGGHANSPGNRAEPLPLLRPGHCPSSLERNRSKNRLRHFSVDGAFA